MVTIDIEQIYVADGTARVEHLAAYLQVAKALVPPGDEVVLTGRGPVWLYLAIAHELHGWVKTLRYDSPVTGPIVIYDHTS